MEETIHNILVKKMEKEVYEIVKFLKVIVDDNHEDDGHKDNHSEKDIHHKRERKLSDIIKDGLDNELKER